MEYSTKVAALGVAVPLAVVCGYAQKVIVEMFHSVAGSALSHVDTVAIVGIGLTLASVPATLLAVRPTLVMTELLLAAGLPSIGIAFRPDLNQDWRGWLCASLTLGGLCVIGIADRFVLRRPIGVTLVAAWAVVAIVGALAAFTAPLMSGAVYTDGGLYWWMLAPLTLFLCLVIGLSSGTNAEWSTRKHQEQ